MNVVNLTDHEKKLFDMIYQGALEYEDGEVGVNTCIEMFCEDNQIDDQTCEWAQEVAFVKAGLEAGVPLEVITGEKKLSEVFPKDYIDYRSNNKKTL